MRVTYRRPASTAALLATLPFVVVGCGLVGGETEAEQPERAPAEEAMLKSRERVQAYLDAMTAKDVAAGRGQLCAVLHEAFDAAATEPNGDFADHFEVSKSEITDIRPGPSGQEVSTAVTVTVGKKKATRPLLFTVTRDGIDWCISDERPGANSPAPAPTP
ncbi:hypothetical protein GCM10029963_67210 [Micromonospora andamanensis]|uniref:hypothetical protein n=1 Tax=Micromonospora andamanensis TaxID=1287068 RepID=UPI00194F9DED|nr:hypothetical protein [Micromonospora andamanensis]GIJ37265.1 hypothetical protein Vwe01_05900 [Micromonospora andamanensis]